MFIVRERHHPQHSTARIRRRQPPSTTTHRDSLGARRVDVHDVHVAPAEVLALAHGAQSEVVLGVAADSGSHTRAWMGIAEVTQHSGGAPHTARAAVRTGCQR